jgi:hypothetical protein
MNHCNATCACAQQNHERIAFELMLKIAETPANAPVTPSDESYATGRDKDYWLALYRDCLATVKQKKAKH